MKYEYDNKLYVTNTHPDLEQWLKRAIEEEQGATTNRISSAVDGVLQLRDNVVRKTTNTLARTYEIDKLRVTKGIPRYSMEVAIGDLINLDFKPGWICNQSDCLEHRMTCQVLLADDVDYSIYYETLVEDGKYIGLYKVSQWEFGVKYIVLPMKTTTKNIAWLRKMCYLIGRENNVFAIREDKFHEFVERKKMDSSSMTTDMYARPNYSCNSTRDRVKRKQYSDFDFPSEYVLLDTEHKTFANRPTEELLSEVAFVHVKDGEVQDEFTKLIKNDGVNLKDHVRFSQLSEDELQTAQYFTEIEDELKEKIGNKPLVGWGIQEDIDLINKNSENPQRYHYVDLRKLAKKYMPQMEDGRMSTLSGYLGLPEQKHRALDDCYTALEVYRRMRQEVSA